MSYISCPRCKRRPADGHPAWCPQTPIEIETPGAAPVIIRRTAPSCELLPEPSQPAPLPGAPGLESQIHINHGLRPKPTANPLPGERPASPARRTDADLIADLIAKIKARAV